MRREYMRERMASDKMRRWKRLYYIEVLRPRHEQRMAEDPLYAQEYRQRSSEAKKRYAAKHPDVVSLNRTRQRGRARLNKLTSVIYGQRTD
jgi:hypothetical protein